VGAQGAQGAGRKRRAEAEELGAAGEVGAGEVLPLFLPTPSFIASAEDEEEEEEEYSFPLFFPCGLLFLSVFLWVGLFDGGC